MPVHLSSYELVDPVALLASLPSEVPTSWWSGLANSYRTQIGLCPGSAWVLLRRGQLDAIDRGASHTLFFDDGTREAAVRGLRFTTRVQAVDPSNTGSSSVYLCELLDHRAELDGVANRVYNWRHSPSDDSPTAYSRDSSSDWTWAGVAGDLWGLLPMGAWPGLPGTAGPGGAPEMIDAHAVPAREVLEDVLALCGCAVWYDPATAAYSVVDLAALADPGAAALAAAAPRVWDASPAPAAVASPEYVRVLFPVWSEDYTVREDAAWVVDVRDPSFASRGDQRQGSYAVIQDVTPARVLFDRSCANSAALKARAAAWAEIHLTRLHGPGALQRCYGGYHPGLLVAGAFDSVTFSDSPAGRQGVRGPSTSVWRSSPAGGQPIVDAGWSMAATSPPYLDGALVQGAVEGTSYVSGAGSYAPPAYRLGGVPAGSQRRGLTETADSAPGPGSGSGGGSAFARRGPLRFADEASRGFGFQGASRPKRWWRSVPLEGVVVSEKGSADRFSGVREIRFDGFDVRRVSGEDGRLVEVSGNDGDEECVEVIACEDPVTGQVRKVRICGPITVYDLGCEDKDVSCCYGECDIVLDPDCDYRLSYRVDYYEEDGVTPLPLEDGVAQGVTLSLTETAEAGVVTWTCSESPGESLVMSLPPGLFGALTPGGSEDATLPGGDGGDGGGGGGGGFDPDDMPGDGESDGDTVGGDCGGLVTAVMATTDPNDCLTFSITFGGSLVPDGGPVGTGETGDLTFAARYDGSQWFPVSTGGSAPALTSVTHAENPLAFTLRMRKAVYYGGTPAYADLTVSVAENCGSSTVTGGEYEPWCNADPYETVPANVCMEVFAVDDDTGNTGLAWEAVRAAAVQRHGYKSRLTWDEPDGVYRHFDAKNNGIPDLNVNFGCSTTGFSMVGSQENNVLGYFFGVGTAQVESDTAVINSATSDPEFLFDVTVKGLYRITLTPNDGTCSAAGSGGTPSDEFLNNGGGENGGVGGGGCGGDCGSRPNNWCFPALNTVDLPNTVTLPLTQEDYYCVWSGAGSANFTQGGVTYNQVWNVSLIGDGRDPAKLNMFVTTTYSGNAQYTAAWDCGDGPASVTFYRFYSSEAGWPETLVLTAGACS